MKILIISLSDLKNDPRVFRQIFRLYPNNEVTCIGYNHPGIEPVHFIQYCEKKITSFRSKLLKMLLVTRNFDLYEHSKYGQFDFYDFLSPDERFDLIIANDLDALPYAMKFRRGAKILYDAHEYSPREIEDKLLWRLFQQKYKIFLCRKYLPQCDAMMTVCQGIAEEYHENFGVNPLVITSAAEYHDCTPSKVDPDHIRMIHHGAPISSRKIENMIFMMDYVDPRFTLDLMLVRQPWNERYYQYLLDLTKSRKNVRLIDSVPMKEIIPKSNNYDIGLFLLEPTNFNYRFALPNKFFEFVQSRLMIAIGPSPEMTRLVKQFDLGIISEDFTPQKMAECLNRLTAQDIERYKMKAHESAKILSSEENMKKLDQIIADLIPGVQS